MSADLKTVEDAVKNWPRVAAPSTVAAAIAGLGAKSTIQAATEPVNGTQQEPLTEHQERLFATSMVAQVDQPKFFKTEDGFHAVRSITATEQAEFMTRRFGG
jgi:hypothetical protein